MEHLEQSLAEFASSENQAEVCSSAAGNGQLITMEYSASEDDDEESSSMIEKCFSQSN